MFIKSIPQTLIINSTYRTKENKEQIDDLVGKPFSILESFKMKGKGSKRMVIVSVSENIDALLNKVSDLSYGSIELRPGGVLIRFNNAFQYYTWIIPYYKLSIYKTQGLSFHADGNYMRFTNNRLMSENKVFMRKLMDKKQAFEEERSRPML